MRTVPAQQRWKDKIRATKNPRVRIGIAHDYLRAAALQLARLDQAAVTTFDVQLIDAASHLEAIADAMVVRGHQARAAQGMDSTDPSAGVP